MKPSYIIGVDLGQSSDYTALCVLECTGRETGRFTHGRGANTGRGWRAGEVSPVYEHHYAVRFLERLPIGTPYPVQVARVKELWQRLKAEHNAYPTLVVDQTGVGRPVVDMLRAAALAPAAVTITGGDTVARDGQDWRAPKRDLVSVVQVLLQTKRLKIARDLGEAQTLTAELLAFKVSISLKGHDSYGNDVGPWRENPHDDLVLAVALAAWYAEHELTQVGHLPRYSQNTPL